jgi:hypothetical protein
MVGRPARLPDRTTAVNSGRRRRRACAGSTSGGEVLATLAPTAGEDRPARAGPHPQPEAVGLRPSAVVRLERALAHEVLLLHDIGGAHPPVGGHAGGLDGRRCAASRRPGSWSLRSGTSRSPPAQSCRADGEAGRNRPQTPASITEETLVPKTGRIATTDGPPGRPLAGGGTPQPTRPGGSTERCRAVDGAVSVAVAPRRTSGSRRVGRPRRSADRRILRSPAETGLRPAGMSIGAGLGARPGSIRRRPCTACGHRCGTSASAHPQRVATGECRPVPQGTGNERDERTRRIHR